MRTTNVFISILSLCIAAAPAMAHKLAPTTVGAYYAGTKKPGNPITFTGGGSYDNDDQTDYDERPRWEWDFDYRGTFTADMNTRSWLANWTYAVPGTYTVAVKYFDDDGQEGNLHTFTILITDLKRLYYVKDHLGSVRLTVDQNGSVVSYDDYDPWGMVLEGRSGNSGDANDKIKFTGKERDKETNYDYFGARYYDSRIGRWMSVDPLAEKYPALTPFNYAADNPVVNVDPNGEWIVKSGQSFFGYGNIVATRVPMTERVVSSWLPLFGSVISPLGKQDPSYSFSASGVAVDVLAFMGGKALQTIGRAAFDAGCVGMSVLFDEGSDYIMNVWQGGYEFLASDMTTFVESVLFSSMERMGLGVEHFSSEMTFYFKNSEIEKQKLTVDRIGNKMGKLQRLIEKLINSMGKDKFKKYIEENREEYSRQVEEEWNNNEE